jgi:hypothetical protein
MKITLSCAMQGTAKWGLSKEWGERRREAKLSCQRILEEMDGERQRLKEHCVANAVPEEDEATLH